MSGYDCMPFLPCMPAVFASDTLYCMQFVLRVLLTALMPVLVVCNPMFVFSVPFCMQSLYCH